HGNHESRQAVRAAHGRLTLAPPKLIIAQPARPAPRSSQRKSPVLRARQKLGKYRIERRLSNGPIAAVYQAFDTIQGVHVALKIPHEKAMDEYFLADFRREARLAPKLEHPNI